MASPFQRRALQRKFIYLGLIVALFTLSWVWRRYVVETKASELSIREESRGDVDLSGSVVRLTLTGSRGLATCVLWTSALDKQKKNQWNELELVVRSLTKLQPHFITPWLFQSWNLSYNVSVESDRVGDKFFYITRGILLLAEGERQNRDNPDLRFHTGFYAANKIHLSDETNVMRSLFQLSIIPPNERDPARFRTLADDGRQVVNFAELEQFCKDHPQLVRRLREGIKRDNKRELRRQFVCERPEDVVQFLADNYSVPSLWADVPAAVPGAWRKDPDPKLKEREERFPTLPPYRVGKLVPPQQLFDPNELTEQSHLGDDIDCHAMSRAWYGYAQEPIPEPGDLPGSNTSPDPKNRARQRRPKQITTAIFRTYPARAQSYQGERLQQEGWFDDEGYEVAGWFQRRDDLPGGTGRPVVVGDRVKWSQLAWENAAAMWQRFGLNNLLILSEAEERNYADQGARFNRKFNKPTGSRVPDDLRTDDMDETTRNEYRAARFLWEYNFYRQLTNFPHHYNQALVEAKDEAIQARKLFFLADRLRLTGNPEQALELYERPEAIRAWRDKVLLKNKDFRRDRNNMEDSYDIQANYLDLFYEQYGRQLRQQIARRLALLALAGQIGQAGARPALVPDWYPLAALARGNPFPDLDVIAGPFDGKDSDGELLITPDVVALQESRRAERQTGRPRRKAPEPAQTSAPSLPPGHPAIPGEPGKMPPLK